MRRVTNKELAARLRELNKMSRKRYGIQQASGAKRLYVMRKTGTVKGKTVWSHSRVISPRCTSGELNNIICGIIDYKDAERRKKRKRRR